MQIPDLGSLPRVDFNLQLKFILQSFGFYVLDKAEYDK